MNEPDAPLCEWCGEQPVKRARHEKFSRRINGKAWRRMCSRQCAGERTRAMQTPEQMRRHADRMLAINRERRKEAVIKYIREAFGQDFTNGTPITVAQAIKLFSMAYTRGYRSRAEKDLSLFYELRKPRQRKKAA